MYRRDGIQLVARPQDVEPSVMTSAHSTQGGRAGDVRFGCGVRRWVYRYTRNMPSDRTIKTAVSLPRRLFEAAERAARRRGVPRSRIFVEALERHLAEEQESDITAQINASLAHPLTQEEAEEEAASQAFAAEAARRLLPHWEWKGDQSG